MDNPRMVDAGPLRRVVWRPLPPSLSPRPSPSVSARGRSDASLEPQPAELCTRTAPALPHRRRRARSAPPRAPAVFSYNPPGRGTRFHSARTKFQRCATRHRWRAAAEARPAVVRAVAYTLVQVSIDFPFHLIKQRASVSNSVCVYLSLSAVSATLYIVVH
ncbi:hypothetical protein O3G_MSEX011042 [Manduca sexta]|uniref:Uncharacterized protein n=1 Tax=Manduca sexta TaxID=7130 RepID=A0A921ZIR7_MANSE|nr:hypothetical protein O3G_MSEX011042 [Manduca sexta]